MKILMVHNNYAKPSGEEHACESIAQLLQERGHCVTWFRKSSADIPPSLGGKARAFFSGIYSFRSRREMDRLLRENDFDIVQVQNLYPLVSPSILAPVRKRGVPMVMRCPNYRLFCPNGLLLSHGKVCERCLGLGGEAWCILRNCLGSVPKSVGYALRNAVARVSGAVLRNAQVFIVLSDFQRRWFVAAGIQPERIAIVPNAAPSALDGDPPGSGEMISFAGRLSPEKGLDDFLAAARALPRQSFSVAGDASHIPGVVREAPPNVTFHGFLRGAPLDEFYRRTKLLVSCSKCFDAFPNAIVTAMRAGKPVIAPRIGPLPEIVEDGVNGLLYEPGNIEQLVDRIKRLAGDRTACETLGEAGCEKALREYSSEAVYARLLSAYEKARALSVSHTSKRSDMQSQNHPESTRARG